MIDPIRLHSGQIRVPFVPKQPNGILGDGIHDIEQEHPEYKEWDRWMDENGMGQDEVYRYGVNDPEANLPTSSALQRHDSRDYPGGIITYGHKLTRAQVEELDLTPIFPDHHTSEAMSETIEMMGGMDTFRDTWDNLPVRDQNAILRQVADNTGESLWTLKHELQGLMMNAMGGQGEAGGSGNA